MNGTSTVNISNETPEWFDKNYLQKILNVYTKNKLKDIKNYKIVPATVKGENFASSMHLITAEYLTLENDIPKNNSFIMKSRLNSEWMSAIEMDFNVFKRESEVYKTIMVQMEMMLHSINDETIFGPRAIYIDEQIIVQENLKTKGYNIFDVKSGLNRDECLLILEKLAKFHATSMVLYSKNSEIFKYHMPGNITEVENPLHAVYKLFIRTTIEYCRIVPKLQKYVSKLESFGEKIIPKVINIFQRNKNDRFHVLNHGDVWVNNMMFRKPSNDTDNVENNSDVLFVDYQESYYGSPGIDWNYFLFTSLQPNVFLNDIDLLIEKYHCTLENILEKLYYNKNIPTIDDVRYEIFNKSDHGLATMTCILPILINEHEELTDPMSFLMDDEESEKNRRQIIFNPKFACLLEIYLEFFEKNNLF